MFSRNFWYIHINNFVFLFAVLDDNDEVLVLFYEDDKSPKTKKIVTTLEKLEFKEYPDLPFVRCSDTAEASAFGVKPEELPQIVLFFNGIPDEYEGIMRN